jgi:lysozyme
VRRRSAEKTLFLTPPDGWIAAPSPILPPKVDYDAAYAVPRQAPAPVSASLDGDKAEARLETGAALLPVPPEEDEQPSLAERAAAAVGARLEAILPDEVAAEVQPKAAPPSTETGFNVSPFPGSEPPEPSPPTLASGFDAAFIAQPEPASTAVDEEPFRLTPPPEAASEPAPPPTIPPEPEATMPASAETLFDRSASGTAPIWGQRLDGEQKPGVVASFDPAFPSESGDRDVGKIVPLLALALAGLVAFAGGVFSGFSAPDAATNHSTAKAIGWFMGVFGVTCFGAAAYLLLRRLDDNGDED